MECSSPSSVSFLLLRSTTARTVSSARKRSSLTDPITGSVSECFFPDTSTFESTPDEESRGIQNSFPMDRLLGRPISVAEKRKTPVEHDCSPGLWTDVDLRLSTNIMAQCDQNVHRTMDMGRLEIQFSSVLDRILLAAAPTACIVHFESREVTRPISLSL